MTDRTHSRATGAVRLLVAIWLLGSAVRTIVTTLDPTVQQAMADSGPPLSVVLRLAGVYFTVGAFLLTGFMSRVAGMILLVVGVWQAATFGLSAMPVIVAVVGVYLMLRGGGAWAMDIYVQKMQDRVRNRQAAEKDKLRFSSPESS